jgi:hypothetical protein
MLHWAALECTALKHYWQEYGRKMDLDAMSLFASSLLNKGTDFQVNFIEPQFIAE